MDTCKVCGTILPFSGMKCPKCGYTKPTTRKPSGGGCFVAGTKIIMADHSVKKIEDVVAGETVIAYNEETGLFEPRKVILSYPHHDTPRVLEIELSNGVKLGVTPGHPLMTTKGWKSMDPANSAWEHNTIATWLEIGDEIIGYHGNAIVLHITEISIPEHYTTYNLEVEACHTYLADGIVVHNAKAQLPTFGRGGLVTQPTQALIGETGRPERVLDPDQTMLFDTLVATLQQATRLSVSAMPDVGRVAGGGGGAGSNFAVDQIIVNVEQLNDDQDYDELADKVFETLVERIQSGSAMGGLFSTT